jgi:hypothetical protein
VDDGEHESRRGNRGQETAARPLDIGERKGQRGGEQELACPCGRQPERGVGAAGRRGERRHGDGAADDGDGWAYPAEERVAGLVGHEQGHRGEHRRLVEHDVGRIDECDAGDEREEAVPERERVAGMEAAVGELVGGVERERPEGVELAHAREVEEPVAANLARDVPEQDTQDDAGPEHPPPARDLLRSGSAPRQRQRSQAGREQEHERQQE